MFEGAQPTQIVPPHAGGLQSEISNHDAPILQARSLSLHIPSGGRVSSNVVAEPAIPVCAVNPEFRARVQGSGFGSRLSCLRLLGSVFFGGGGLKGCWLGVQGCLV